MSKHEIIAPDEHIPAWMFLHRQNVNSYIEPHWHASIELSYTSKGNIDHFIIAGESYRTTPGTILVTNTMEIHSVRTFQKPEVEQRALTLIFPYSVVNFYFPLIDEYYFAINHLTDEERQNSEPYQHLVRNFEKIMAIYDTDDTLSKTILILEILQLLLQNFLEKRLIPLHYQQDMKQREQLNKIKTYIEDNYQADISLEDIAKVAYFSKEHLSRFFKEHMGITVFQYLNYVRAKNAKHQLQESGLPAGHIAVQCGFSGLRSMDRALIQAYGMPSRELKKQKKCQ